MTQDTFNRGRRAGWGLVPPRGEPGQFLVKSTSADGDVDWASVSVDIDAIVSQVEAGISIDAGLLSAKNVGTGSAEVLATISDDVAEFHALRGVGVEIYLDTDTIVVSAAPAGGAGYISYDSAEARYIGEDAGYVSTGIGIPIMALGRNTGGNIWAGFSTSVTNDPAAGQVFIGHGVFPQFQGPVTASVSGVVNKWNFTALGSNIFPNVGSADQFSTFGWDWTGSNVVIGDNIGVGSHARATRGIRLFDNVIMGGRILTSAGISSGTSWGVFDNVIIGQDIMTANAAQLSDFRRLIIIGHEAVRTLGNQTIMGSGVAIGYQAGSDSWLGSGVIIGDGAGTTSVSANSTIIGNFAGTTGWGSSVVIGDSAGNDSGGKRNVVIGADAGSKNSGTVEENVLIGYAAGATNSVQGLDSRNIIIGCRMGNEVPRTPISNYFALGWDGAATSGLFDNFPPWYLMQGDLEYGNLFLGFSRVSFVTNSTDDVHQDAMNLLRSSENCLFLTKGTIVEPSASTETPRVFGLFFTSAANQWELRLRWPNGTQQVLASTSAVPYTRVV